jgi:hypothetical protein
MRQTLIVLLSALLVVACSDDTSPRPPDASVDGPRGDGGAGLVCATPLASCTQALPDRFDQSTTLAKGCYHAKKSPILGKGVTLTVSPGVTIIFAEKTGLTVNDDQILKAVGTAAEPICLTGEQGKRGFWKGVLFGSTESAENKLDHVIVEYAGNLVADSQGAAVKATADSRGVKLSLTNTILRESLGWGLSLGGSAVVGAFASNTLTKNTLGPAKVSSEVVGVLDAASSYKGNDRDQLVVDAQYISKPATWATLDVPYFIDSGLRTSVDWTLSPGTTIIAAMGMSVKLTIEGDTGALIAAGTAAKPITFSCEEQKRGCWEGLLFDGSNNTRNTLAHVTVEHAGNTTSDKDSAAVKLTGDSHGVQVKISDTTVRESQGWGLFATGSAILPSFTGNTLTKNTLGPIAIGSEAVHQLLPASSYKGNDVDRIDVRDNNVSKAVTWELLDVPYRINGIVKAKLVWTIAPGVTLLMAQGAGVYVGGDDAAFHAVGTAQKPILITGVEKIAGAWETLFFDTSNNGASAFDYCTVEYGGGGTAKGQMGMILATADSHGVTLSVTNSKIQHSAVFGIWLSQSAKLTQSGNTFASNKLGDTFKQP